MCVKLAEALLLRADIQKKIASLRERVVANAVVQQGDKPHEDPTVLMKEATGAMATLETLVTNINKTNLHSKLKDGRTLTEAIAHRDTLAAHHALVIAAIGGARKEPDRYGMREIKWVATIKISAMQKQADDLAKTIRELNGRIQEANWKVDLVTK